LGATEGKIGKAKGEFGNPALKKAQSWPDNQK
jgi:hypothetical protein